MTPDLLRLREDYEVSVNAHRLSDRSQDPSLVFDPSNLSPATLSAMRAAVQSFRPGIWPRPDLLCKRLAWQLLKISPIYRLSALGIEAQRRERGVEFGRGFDAGRRHPGLGSRRLSNAGGDARWIGLASWTAIEGGDQMSR